MSNYRILEKKGTYKPIGYFCGSCICPGIETCKNPNIYSVTGRVNREGQAYIPRFIVQEKEIIFEDDGSTPDWEWQDLKEFTSLEEAREYKRDLELDEGIVRE